MCLHSLALKEASNALKSRYTEDTLASDLRVLVSSEHYTPTRALARFFHSLLSPEASDDEVWAALLAFAAKARQDLDRSQQNAASAKVISPTQSELNDALQKVYRHWNTKFCGHAKLALQEKLLLYENTTRQYHQNFYAKIIPIIQSSGMGKSRLMDELSKIHLTILFTFRKNGESGFPPGDPEITRFVDKALSWKGNKPQRSQEELMMAHSHALALVLGALRTLSKWLRRQALKANKDVLPQEDIARKWYERMAPRSKDVEISSTGALSDIIATTRSKRRIKFCNQTIHMAEKILQELNEDKEWKAFFMPETDDFEGLESLEYAQKLQQRVNRIIMRLVSIPDADPPRLLLVFDESSRLFDTSGGGHFFPALRRILRVLRQQPIWTFLLSTDSAMDLLAKPSNEEQSQRLVIHQLGRYDPFIALQLDLSMVEKMSSCKGQLLRTPLNGFSTPEHMAMFGRPLWAMYEKCAIHTIHTFALAKLFNSDGSYNPANKDHVFAAMAYRLSLDPTTSVVDSSAKNLARRAVCAHLRVVVQMDLTTGTFETTTPSEPIAVDSLAMMLCLRIVPGGHTYWQASLDTLTCELLKPGNVGKGEKGELYFRTLFILNRDFYLCRQVPGSPQGHMPYSRPFRLLDFLQYMLPEGIYKTVSQMFSRQATRGSARVKQPGLAAPRKLAEVFEGALCNFSHFVCTSQQLVMDSESSANNLELIHGLMMQQAALQCSTDQYLFDFVIPIYLGDPDADFNRQHLSALLVQVKNTKKEHRIDLKGHKNDYPAAKGSRKQPARTAVPQ
ncbi:hypothetical protein BGX38DRAFT_1146839 [Terfezia claveryi]|nr:hypothetical protein BGX38DRAFT_1146839 [Terfezia claveryi]